ncbi:LysM peptidoglycan-binding domain-containing protein [Rhizobium alvei]|uniref:LysM peptidoglycan-binding domain-containing protein n=1 Tax=Rhizobium alvei TaxID=1132659 RepID=A0ABT8YK62_9HYPH|nr:LysM peptidoglycan-binding domain-containing protein [Rhizobium alvei]MDO6963640.1 LysM peptidoglycan-binding domain-containing protein [Rhizobium alvei]
MKNRAIWVVLGVLVIAALLMFFLVLPQMRGKDVVQDLAQKAGETVTKAADTVNKAAEEVKKTASDTGEDLKSIALEKMARLKSDALGAMTDFDKIFADGKMPTAEEIAAAKAKLQATLKSAADISVPEGIDKLAGGAVGLAQDAAKKGLAILDKMPTDAEGARKTYEELKSTLGEAFGLKPAENGAAAPVNKTENEAKPAEAKDAAASLPAFDVVRVEPDGNTVIAGRAEPGSALRFMDQGKEIAKADVGATGDFVAILDNPLPAGDHSIVIEATGKDGKVQTSEETATISVPADGKGELLAMVTKPGEASRILTMPEAKPVETAAKAADAAATATKAVEPGADSKTPVTPDLPSASADLAGTAPNVDVAATEQKNAETPVAQADAKPAAVSVSAVEIEGDKLFVAGNARPGSALRIYADDKLLADVTADAQGRFVAEGVLPLTVGDHTIRADLLGTDGKKVELRASVPFFRPEGEQLAAVADASGEKTKGAMQPLADGTFDKAREEARKSLGLLKGLYDNGKTPSPEELAAARSATEIALKSLADLKLPAGVDPMIVEMASKTSAEAAKALDALKNLPTDAAAIKSALASIETGVGLAIAPVIETDGGQHAATKSETAATDTKPATTAVETPATKVETPAAADTQAKPAGETAEVASKAEQPVSGDASASSSAGTQEQPKEIVQAPLKHSDSSVIIRRGDTLWQISRRVYGKGVRYTTIYLANQAQISDPDKIMPGQIFGVPDKPLDNSEQLHRKRLGLQ